MYLFILVCTTTQHRHLQPTPTRIINTQMLPAFDAVILTLPHLPFWTIKIPCIILLIIFSVLVCLFCSAFFLFFCSLLSFPTHDRLTCRTSQKKLRFESYSELSGIVAAVLLIHFAAKLMGRLFRYGAPLRISYVHLFTFVPTRHCFEPYIVYRML